MMSHVNDNFSDMPGGKLVRVALSLGGLCDPGLRGEVDGIGVYARQLWRRLEACPDVELHPVAGYGRRFCAAAGSIVGRFTFPCPYVPSAGLSLLTGAAFPGSSALDGSVDVFHATDAKIPKLRGVPVVATLHDAIPLANPEWATQHLRTLKNYLIRAAAQWADAVITDSIAMVPQIAEQFRIPSERITPIYPGVDERWFQRIDADVSASVIARYGLAPGFFLMVGTLQPRKNVARLLAAYRALPARIRAERQLVVVGRIGWSAEALVAQLRAATAQGEVRWLEYVVESDLRVLYQSAGAFVFPSLWEGFGFPVLEAFASGTPVVTSNLSALPEIAGEAAVLVDPYQVDAIRDAMLRLAEDEALRSHLAAAGLLRAQQFSWDACAKRVLGVYRTIA
jgi:glycosyltransferase involved in cell wall biosynthesis